MTDSPPENTYEMNESEYLNPYRIVHIYNKSNIYHLTRQMLLDSSMQISLAQNTYSFFYHILSKGSDDFNDTYGSFAYIDCPTKSTKSYHVDLYMNVDTTALDYIIEYIQKRTINKKISKMDDINQLIDLATMFGMPDLVEQLRKKIPTETYVKDVENLFKGIIKLAIINICTNKRITYAEETIDTILNKFFNQNRELISTHIVNLFNNRQIWFELIQLGILFYDMMYHPQILENNLQTEI